MNGRNRRRNRQAGMKARLGIATALLVGGGAVGVAAVAAANQGPATTAADSAAYSFSHTLSMQQALTSAFSTMSWSQRRTLTTLGHMAPLRTFSQVTWHRTTLAAQRGVVLAVTKKFLVVKSANGKVEVWWLRGTKLINVTANATGSVAMMGNNVAAKAAATGNTAPAANAMAGGMAAMQQAAAPTKPITITVSTGTQIITITISAVNGAPMASVSPSPMGSVSPSAMAPVMASQAVTVTPTPTATMAANNKIAAGDFVFVGGVKVHGSLIAKLVLFSATNTLNPAPTASTATSVAPTGTVNPTAVAPTGVSGTHF
jgi:hypothetical protein